MRAREVSGVLYRSKIFIYKENKMADERREESEKEKCIDLRAQGEDTDRGTKFWNTSSLQMKFSVEKDWIKSVRNAKRKPNYGMAQMDGLLEEVVGNKLELAGPLIDSFLKEIGKSMVLKLSHSKATGLMNPTILFIPWPVFRHMLVLVRGYGGEVHQNSSGSKFIVTVKSLETVSKLFSPSRFAGECYFAYRHFKKVPAKVGSKKQISVYNGRSAVVVTDTTPFCLDYNMQQQRATVSFYVQRYTAHDFAVDSSLQALMNQ